MAVEGRREIRIFSKELARRSGDRRGGIAPPGQ